MQRLGNFSGRFLRDDLSDIIVGQKTFPNDQPSWSDRGHLSNLFILQQGFAFKFEILPNGQRHIADFFGPGAICNWSRLSAFEEQDDILFKAHSVATILDARKLEALLDDKPGLASIIKRHELARTMRVTQRVRALISLSATESLLVVLLDLYDEFATAGFVDDRIPMPFIQQELADLLGVTPVHISRTFSRLEEDGIVERNNRSIRLTDATKVRESLSYRSFFHSGGRK
ncbi:Crp/Fnr family transcriptional regulator [Erythrobacter sp. SD-21]|uniref:Crp/Fnr family transcriptional regulator n=1 Tax=Erythrobacter sp. SD-21 TaxID=161528 RepID=UPI000153FB37|nr:Crp/Fnr family transcriptional regulator [Erythrobacter sp. SD-21]EDL49703.1 cyclic nucleotide-binding domain (cNMP-BD) protein [Erythrobacter sp. SD-21]